MLDKFKNIFKKTIHVSFINIETGKVFAVSDMLPEQLPGSFEARTTMHLGDEDWEVAEAIPVSSEEFIKTKELKLILRKVKIGTMDPNKILFSLPTISNELPPIKDGSTKLQKNVFEILEDDWRQIDIIPENKLDFVKENLSSIKNIYENKSKQVGEYIAFNGLHVRFGLDYPFDNHRIEKQTLLNGFIVESVYEGIAFNGVAGLVDGGFAVNIGENMTLYGLEQNNIINCLSLFYKDEDSFQKEIENVLKVLTKHELCLVDWCKMKLYRD